MTEIINGKKYVKFFIAHNNKEYIERLMKEAEKCGGMVTSLDYEQGFFSLKFKLTVLVPEGYAMKFTNHS